MTATLTELVWARQHGLCLCGLPLAGFWDSWSVHHRKLRSQGGTDDPSNVIGLQGSGTTGCHGWAHHHRAEAEKLGLIVPSWADPAAIPVQSAVHRAKIILLDDWTITTGGD